MKLEQDHSGDKRGKLPPQSGLVPKKTCGYRVSYVLFIQLELSHVSLNSRLKWQVMSQNCASRFLIRSILHLCTRNTLSAHVAPLYILEMCMYRSALDTLSLQINLFWNGALQLARSNGQLDIVNCPLFHCNEGLLDCQYLNLIPGHSHNSPRWSMYPCEAQGAHSDYRSNQDESSAPPRRHRDRLRIPYRCQEHQQEQLHP